METSRSLSASAVTKDWWHTAQPAPWTCGLVKVTSFRVVVRDGWYNQGADLLKWEGYYWLSYGRGTSHGIVQHEFSGHGANNFGVVLCSNDLRRWHQAKVIEPPGGIRGGRAAGTPYLTASRERLYGFFDVLTPPESKGPSSSNWVTWTADGTNWSEPVVVRLGESYPRTRHPRWHDGKFWCAVAHHEHGHSQFDLCVSEDGIQWTRHAQITAGDGASDEADLHWRPDGELWCIVRLCLGSQRSGAHMFWSKPPYTEWEGGGKIGWGDAPAICASGDEVYLAGRGPTRVVQKPDEIGGKKGTTTLWRLKRGSMEELVSFPAGGDASYPGLTCQETGKLVVAFYSDFAYQTGAITPKYHPEYVYKRSANDIYLAEIEVAG